MDRAGGALDHLVRRHPRAGRATWSARIARGEVTLDGARIDDSARVAPGQELAWRRPPWVEPWAPLSFAVLHRDDDLLAVAKPRGLPVLPGGGRFQDHTLLVQVRRRHPEASPVHRLGAGTSGIVLCARRPAAARALSAAFRDGAVTREYLALARGDVAVERREIDAPIGPCPHPTLGTVRAVADDGRAARTHLDVVERRGDSTLLRVRIDTGRSHQIRAHLAWIGHPLVGDPLFAAGGGFVTPAAGEGEAARPTDGGYALHAGRLVVPHPSHGANLEVTCPAPPVLRARGSDDRGGPGWVGPGP